jgi:P22 coat protein - gene protein 5
MNVLTNLIAPIYVNLDVVSRELTGAVASVSRDPRVARAAVGQTVYTYQTPAQAASDITPGVTPPNDGDQTIGNVPIQITKARRVPIRWSGEEQLSLNNNGPGTDPIINDQIQQAFRTLANEMEQDVVAAARKAASRATGTAGTTPFASNLSDPAQARKILDDNGAPGSDRAMIIDTTAGANMRTLSQLTKANEAGDTVTLRSGELMQIHGLSIHESAAVQSITPGTGASYTTNTAGYAVGATAITLITGSGTINAGDVITFAGDPNKYVVAQALAGGVVTLAKPGLRKAIPASATAVTVVSAFTPNIALVKSACVLATRLPALPMVNGQPRDMAVDRVVITDPRTGISFDLAAYLQYHQLQYEVGLAWGVGAVKPENIALLLG